MTDTAVRDKVPYSRLFYVTKEKIMNVFALKKALILWISEFCLILTNIF